ncbi:methyltransferase domain protein [Ceratobasidium sp. AG-Ba]|nr:methyltransferase domain protein [Ceratobasidium sp. AG-Ba]QRW11680.1 methyltransferase domain protein [Ceratobasidium sp. AG-Ba]
MTTYTTVRTRIPTWTPSRARAPGTRPARSGPTRLAAHGLMYPMDENLPLTFPADEIELRRHQMRHHILKVLLRGNYVGPVQHVLRPRADGRRPRILDIRTCCGTWAQEMATEFPHCDITSVDIVPITAHVPRPNVVFEVYDIYQGLAEEDESFDYISCRTVQVAMKEYDRLLFDLHRVLRPGGLLCIGEIEHRLYEVDQPPYTTLATKSFPHVCRGIEFMRKAITNQGVDLEAIHRIGDWMRPGSQWWKRTGERYQIPPDQIARASTGIHPMQCQVVLLPTGTWNADPALAQVGLMTNRLCQLSWRQVVGVLAESGMGEEEVGRVCQDAVDEWVEAEGLGARSLIKYWMWWGFKPDRDPKK